MEAEEGPIVGQKRQGHTQRNCSYCNRIVYNRAEYVLIDSDGNIISSGRSLNKNKAWELTKDENVKVVAGSGRRAHSDHVKDGKKWRGIDKDGGDRTKEAKQTTQGGRQAKKIARQQKAKGAKNTENRMPGSKAAKIAQLSTSPVPWEASNSHSGETSSSAEDGSSSEEDSSSEEFLLKIDSLAVSPQDRARIRCKQCAHGADLGKWTGETQRRAEAKDYRDF